MDNLRKHIRHILLEEFSASEKAWFKEENNPNRKVDNSKKALIQKAKKLTDEEATVGEILREIQNSNKKTWVSSIWGGFKEFVFWMALPLLPVLGTKLLTLAIIWSIFRSRQNEMAPQFKKIEKFPLFKKMTMHPDYVKILDDPLLNDIMKKYEAYLMMVKPETKISEVTSINDFIKRIVENNTVVRISLQESLARAKTRDLIREHYKKKQ